MFKKGLIKKHKGFTLFEAIISVAIICICSVTILNIFVKSGSLNAQANEMDNGNSILTNTFELCNTVSDFEEFTKLNVFEDSFVQSNDKMQDIYLVYDKNWNKIKLDIPTFDVNSLPDGSKFLVHYNITNEEQGNGNQIISFVQNNNESTKLDSMGQGSLITINGNIDHIDFTQNTNERKIGKNVVSLSATKYISNVVKG